MMKKKVKTLRGLKTGYLIHRNPGKPVLLFLHGFPDDPFIFKEQFEALKGSYEIIAPYMRGVDESDAKKGLCRFDLDALTLDYLELLEFLAPDRPLFIICHDLGVPQAARLAPLLRKRLCGLICLAGLPISLMLHRLKSPRQHVRSFYMHFFQVPMMPQMLLSRFELSLLNIAYTLGSLPKELRPKLKENRMKNSFNHYRAYLRAALKKDVRRPKPIDTKTLFLWGAGDRLILPPTLDELSQDFWQVTVRILKGGHWFFRENPKDVHLIINDFIEEALNDKRADGT